MPDFCPYHMYVFESLSQPFTNTYKESDISTHVFQNLLEIRISEFIIFYISNTFQADFNLLFHSILLNHKTAFDLLLQSGADPLRVNTKGTSIMSLMMKRGKIDWAQMALDAIENELDKQLFVNSKSYNGN